MEKIVKMKKQEQTYIYRIIHRENLQVLIDEGKLVAPNYATNKNYIPIGEQQLIKRRGDKKVMLEPDGTLRDYISFYFGVRSPMLYCIANGYDVQKLDQENIIYLITSIEKLDETGVKFVFTDGHSYSALTRFFNNISDLIKIDWKTVHSKRWNNLPDDPDRKRRKEAECLVYKELTFDKILAISVYNQNASNYISSVLQKNNLNIPVLIKPDWYY